MLDVLCRLESSDPWLQLDLPLYSSAETTAILLQGVCRPYLWSGCHFSYAAELTLIFESANCSISICQALQTDPLTRYLASDAEPATLRQVVTSYGEHLLGEAASADLLFQVDDFAAAALCYRMPEQLVN